MKQNWSATSIVCIILISLRWIEVTDGRRGPHHPRGQVAQSRPPKLDEHLEHEHDHLREDLGDWAIKSKDLSDMTEDEKNFYYFKVHDSDNNDFLDGLEMLQAATHRTGHIHKQERDEQLEDSENELNRIIDVIDDFLSFADLNHDGFLDYPEYAKAINTHDETTSQQSPIEHQQPLGKLL